MEEGARSEVARTEGRYACGWKLVMLEVGRVMETVAHWVKEEVLAASCVSLVSWSARRMARRLTKLPLEAHLRSPVGVVRSERVEEVRDPAIALLFVSVRFSLAKRGRKRTIPLKTRYGIHKRTAAPTATPNAIMRASK